MTPIEIITTMKTDAQKWHRANRKAQAVLDHFQRGGRLPLDYTDFRANLRGTDGQIVTVVVTPEIVVYALGIGYANWDRPATDDELKSLYLAFGKSYTRHVMSGAPHVWYD